MAKGFKHGTSGSTLNFKVVGNPQPANPKENTIWIDTDQKITGWEFSATQPTGSTGVMKTVSGQTITVADGSDAPMQGLKIFGKTTQNGTPTPDAPVPLESVGNGGSVGVTVAGKNLLDFEACLKALEATYTKDGEKYTITNPGYGFARPVILFKERTKVSIQGVIKNITAVNGRIEFGYFKDGVFTAVVSIREDLSKSDSTYITAFRLNHSTSGTYTVENLQIELSATATAYEPYKEAQTLTLSTPNGLPGIPVSSGGNYTDENGQQWICDEVDFASGKYVQRVDTSNLGEYTWTPWGDAFWATVEGKNTGYNMLSNVYPVSRKSVDKTISGNAQNENIYIRDSSYTTADELKTALADAVLLYELATPIEHNLSEEELAQYAALHTNDPSTTIYNDAGACMEVKYEKGTDLDGAVWITTGPFSTVAFNALKKDGIQVYPISAKQYVGGAWVDKTAKSYQNGEWVDWCNGELFDNGNQFEAATGGWTSDGITFATMSVVGATITSNKITFTTNASSITCIQTKNKINCAKYSRLYVEFMNISGSNNRAVEFGLFSGRDMANNSVAVQTPALTPTGEKRTEYLDISEYDGSYYVGCVAGHSRSGEVYRVWME